MITSKYKSSYCNFDLMRFIVLIMMILSPFIGGTVAAESVQPPRTYIPFNTKKGCAVHVATWLSPSCTHCADYFASDIPKITAMPGFCLDLHFLPHLYLLDMPVAILIWSQGPENAYKIAGLFFKNQSKWLDPSASREKMDDPRRTQDIEEYLTEIKSDPSKDIPRIKNYLAASDPFLYVKMFALRHFSIEHMAQHLPTGDAPLNSQISLALVKDLPRKDDAVVKFSPAFTNMSGQLLPESQLHNGILTPSAAEDLLKAAGPFMPPPTAAPVPLAPSAVPAPAPKKRKLATKAQHIDIEGAQDADNELHRTLENLTKENHDEDHHEVIQPPKKKQKRSPYDDKHILKIPKKGTAQHQEPSPYDDNIEDTDMHDEHNDIHIEDETTKKSKKLEEVLNNALQGLDTGHGEHEDSIDHMLVN